MPCMTQQKEAFWCGLGGASQWTGLLVEADKIPVHPLTEKICRILELDPTADCSMIMATSDPEILVTELTVRGTSQDHRPVDREP